MDVSLFGGLPESYGEEGRERERDGCKIRDDHVLGGFCVAVLTKRTGRDGRPTALRQKHRHQIPARPDRRRSRE